MNREIDFIREHTPVDELLCQLAEECTELAHAGLKYRRALTGDNPTPITEEQARENLLEEIADVSLCLKALGMDHIDREFCLDIAKATNAKARRWAERIKEKYESAKQ